MHFAKSASSVLLTLVDGAARRGIELELEVAAFMCSAVCCRRRSEFTLPAQPTRCCQCKATVTHPNWGASFDPTVAAFVRWTFLFPPANRGEISRSEYCNCWGSYAPPAHRTHRNEAIASSSRCSATPAARKSRSAACAFSKVIHSVSGASGADHLSRR